MLCRSDRLLHLNWCGSGSSIVAVVVFPNGDSRACANYGTNDSALPCIAVADIVADYGTSNSPYNRTLGGGSGGAVLGT